MQKRVDSTQHLTRVERVQDLYFRFRWLPYIVAGSAGVGGLAGFHESALAVGICSTTIATTLLMFLRRGDPTRNLYLPELVRETDENKRLLVFLHGWKGAPSTWADFPLLVAQDRRFDDFDIASINYPTYIGRRNLSLTQLSSWILGQMESRGYFGKYEKLAVIAHSMGGLIARQLVMLRRLSTPAPAIRVLVEIGTPHRGARAAGIARALGVYRFLSRWRLRELAPGQESMPSKYGRLLADGKCPTPDSRSGCLLIACRW